MERVDVAVVGAGFAGLTAARELCRGGMRVVVLEAAQRVGGRAYTVPSAAGSAVELGGQWVGHGHARMTELARAHGVSLFPTPEAQPLILRDGDRALPLWSPPVLAAGAVLGALELLTRKPGAAPDVPVARFLARVPSDRARRLLGVLLAETVCTEPDRVSVRALAAGVRAAGGVRQMLGMRGEAQDSLLTGGAGGLADAVAAGLDVRTGWPVRALTETGGGVRVAGPTGEMVAERVIVAVPAPVAGIRHEPPVPGRAVLRRDTVMGVVYKAVAVYPEPFWRERGRGDLLRLDGPVPAVFDVSPPGGPGHLCVLVPGRAALALDALGAAARRRAVLDVVARHAGAAALEPVDWHEKSWHTDSFVGGGYAAVPVPGRFDAVARAGHAPAGRVHWAGTETAERCAGYLEGAVRSGERAAAEVLAAR